MQSITKDRRRQIKDLQNRMPEGRSSGYLKLILYKLAEDDIIMTESQLRTFFASYYSSVADEIIAAFTAVVEKMEADETRFQQKLQEKIDATKAILEDAA